MTSDSYFTLGFYVRKLQTERAEYPIFARISVAGQATEFKIGRTVDPENWDAKKVWAEIMYHFLGGTL